MRESSISTVTDRTQIWTPRLHGRRAGQLIQGWQKTKGRRKAAPTRIDAKSPHARPACGAHPVGPFEWAQGKRTRPIQKEESGWNQKAKKAA